ncbi:MAG: hypothetical protein NT170_02715 [Candidatus Moranbacteria bacterium]|nr:hypothetical protein [Candidatus Moranbacteria bacterium]
MAISQGKVFALVVALIISLIIFLMILGVVILGHILVFAWNHLAITMGVVILIIAGIMYLFKKY